MKTYQDLLLVGESEQGRMEFVQTAINDYKSSTEYCNALDARLYMEGKNATISKYQKLLYTLSGKAIPDNYTANHKCKSGFFKLFTTQENSYLLKNGVVFDKEETYKRLGDNFNNDLYSFCKDAMATGVSYGFFNLDRVDFFKMTEFVPLYDEENGSLRAGIRFWQVDSTKPLRCTLYEESGYTDYFRAKDKPMEVLNEKRKYVQKVVTSEIEGTRIYDGENYPSFPIVPLFVNLNHQSELAGHRESIDCYDLIKSGFANDLDDASAIYWTLKNTGGMDDIDMAEFIERMKTLKVAMLDDGVEADSHTIEVPYQSREVYLTRLETDLYRDFMALDVRLIASGNITATQIDASYEPLDEKATEMAVCVEKFIKGLFEVAGIDDNVTFKPHRIVNQREITEMVLMCANYLDEQTVLEKLPFLTDEEVDEILKRKIEEDSARFETEEDNEPENNPEEEGEEE